jgi:hypothetical protein
MAKRTRVTLVGVFDGSSASPATLISLDLSAVDGINFADAAKQSCGYFRVTAASIIGTVFTKETQAHDLLVTNATGTLAVTSARAYPASAPGNALTFAFSGNVLEIKMTHAGASGPNQIFCELNGYLVRNE